MRSRRARRPYFISRAPWTIVDRKTYFERCWPNSETIAGFEFINLTSDGEHAFVTYEGRSTSSKRFRNTEILTIQNGKIIEVTRTPRP
jgi:hypothetical protein